VLELLALHPHRDSLKDPSLLRVHVRNTRMNDQRSKLAG
jgi:hypothetical protein